MADHQPYERPTDAFRGILPENGPSTSQLLAVVTLVPISAFLLFLAGITLTGTVIALAVSTPLWVIFSPILIPAALVVFLAVAGFLTSGAFGVTALSSLSWMANNLRGSRVPGQLEQAKRWVREAAEQAAEKEKAKEAGETIRSKALDGEMSEEGARAQTQEGGKGEQVGRAQEGGRNEQSERAQEVERAQEKSSSKEQGGKVQEGAKAQGGGKAQKGGKGQGGGKAQESGKT